MSPLNLCPSEVECSYTSHDLIKNLMKYLKVGKKKVLEIRTWFDTETHWKKKTHHNTDHE